MDPNDPRCVSLVYPLHSLFKFPFLSQNIFRRAPVPVATVIIPTTVKRKFVGHESDINTIQCGMTGRFFATGSNDLKIKIHDATGVLKTTINGCTQSVMCVQFSRGDEWILGASNDHATRIWGVETGRLRHTLTGHVGKVFSARFSYDTTKVVTGSHDRTLKIWDLQKGNCTPCSFLFLRRSPSFDSPRKGIRNIFCFSSCNDLCLLDDSGSSIASGHLDSQLRIWDARSGNCVTELVDLHQGQITSLTLSPDNHSLLTNSRDGTLKLVDLRSSRALSTFTAENYRPGVNWARACFRYASSGGAWRYSDLEPGQPGRRLRPGRIARGPHLCLERRHGKGRAGSAGASVRLFILSRFPPF